MKKIAPDTRISFSSPTAVFSRLAEKNTAEATSASRGADMFELKSVTGEMAKSADQMRAMLDDMKAVAGKGQDESSEDLEVVDRILHHGGLDKEKNPDLVPKNYAHAHEVALKHEGGMLLGTMGVLAVIGDEVDPGDIPAAAKKVLELSDAAEKNGGYDPKDIEKAGSYAIFHIADALGAEEIAEMTLGGWKGVSDRRQMEMLSRLEFK